MSATGETGIVQTTTFTCQVCGHVEQTVEDVSLYSETIVMSPNGGWNFDYVEIDGVEKFVCLKCMPK